MTTISLAAQCDGCDKTTLDYMKDGWVTLKGELVKYLGRDKNGSAKSEMFLQTHSEDEKHFHSLACLLNQAQKKKS